MAVLALVIAAVLGIYQVTQRSAFVATAAEDAQSVTRSTLEELVTDLRLINAGRCVSNGASCLPPTGFIIAASPTSITFLGDIDNDTLDGAGNDATLVAAAAGGATTVQVSSATGFSVGEWFSIENGATSETQLITKIAGTTLTLGAGLANAYPPGSIVRSVETVSYALDPATGNLCRQLGAACPAPPFPNNLVAAGGLTTFQLTYWDGSTNPIPVVNLATQPGRDTIREIRVTISSRAQMGDRTMVRTMTTSVRPRNF